MIKILLVISIALNGYFIWDTIRVCNKKDFEESMSNAFSGKSNTTTWKEGLKLFVKKLKEKDKTLVEKKYYYINIWTNWCGPCIREMPWLDSIAGTLKKDVAYVFVSDINDTIAKQCLEKKKYNIKNFVFINGMNDFVAGICNEQKVQGKSYPMVLVIDNKGKIFHYAVGAYEDINEASEFSDLINKLP